MDFLIASSILGVLRDSAEVLLLGNSESLSLVLWGSVLLAVGASVKALLAPKRRFNVRQPQAHVNYVSEHRSLTQGQA